MLSRLSFSGTLLLLLLPWFYLDVWDGKATARCEFLWNTAQDKWPLGLGPWMIPGCGNPVLAVWYAFSAVGLLSSVMCVRVAPKAPAGKAAFALISLGILAWCVASIATAGVNRPPFRVMSSGVESTQWIAMIACAAAPGMATLAAPRLVMYFSTALFVGCTLGYLLLRLAEAPDVRFAANCIHAHALLFFGASSSIRGLVSGDRQPGIGVGAGG